MRNSYPVILSASLLLAAFAVPASSQVAQTAAQPVPRESESNAVTGITVERFLGDASLSAPRIVGNAMLTRAILTRGDPTQAGWPGAVLVQKQEIVAASLQSGEATSMMQRADQLVGYVKSGTGRLDDGRTGWELKQGYTFFVPANATHRLSSTGDTPLEMTILAGPPPATGAATSVLVRDTAKMLYVEQGAHWVNMSKAPFRDIGERVLFVYMAPMTVAGAHAHVPGTEEAWVKMTDAPALLQLGSEIRNWRKDQGLVIPPNGRTIHAAINHSNERQVWFYFSTFPPPANPGPAQARPAPDPAFTTALEQSNVAGVPLARGEQRRR